MEYYILKRYQSEKQKCPEVEPGLERYEPKTKKIIIVCIIVILISFAEMLFSLLLFPKQPMLNIIGIFFCIIAMLIFYRIDNRDKEKHIRKYVYSHKKKIEILKNILANEYGINTKIKVEELINIYQEYVEKKKEEEKRRNKVIFTIMTVFAGVLVTSLENMGLIGINFVQWLYIATILFVFVAAAVIIIYAISYFDVQKAKYEMMIKDLKILILLNY